MYSALQAFYEDLWLQMLAEELSGRDIPLLVGALMEHT